MLVERPFRLTNASGDIVRGDLRYRDDGVLKPLILICHGFNTNKDWGPFPYIGKRLAEEGFCTIVFNFSHNGVGEGGFFSEYDRFARNTPGKELIDVQAILDSVTGGETGAGVADTGRIGMAGHSRGGGISILTAAGDKRVKSIVAWATISAFLRYTSGERERWIRTGYFPLRYGLSRTLLRYEVSVLHDLEKNAERYNLFRGIRSLKIPVLFVHGSDDDIVSSEEARELFEVADKANTRFLLIPGAGHTFGVEHPFRGTTAETETMITQTIDWFHKTLNEETS
jgi:dipeptidyl aminopeptidase/acylaminoacyl peptidase